MALFLINCRDVDFEVFDAHRHILFDQ